MNNPVLKRLFFAALRLACLGALASLPACVVNPVPTPSTTVLSPGGAGQTGNEDFNKGGAADGAAAGDAGVTAVWDTLKASQDTATAADGLAFDGGGNDDAAAAGETQAGPDAAATGVNEHRFSGT